MGATLDIYKENSDLDLVKLKGITGANQTQLANILDVSVGLVKKNTPSPAVIKKAKHLVYSLKLLAIHFGNDTTKMRGWFLDPKTYWNGLTPLDMFILKRGEAVVETLKQLKEGEAHIGS